MTNPLSRREFLEISACASAMSGALPTGDAPSMARTASAVESSADQAAGTSSDWFTGTMAASSGQWRRITLVMPLLAIQSMPKGE